MSDSNVVPFGKHKGEPVERLLADRQYLDWLLQQPWFAVRYPEIHNLIIGGTTNIIIGGAEEPTETPEHNAIQLLFLDEEFCNKFIKKVRPGVGFYFHGQRFFSRRKILYPVQFEYTGKVGDIKKSPYPIDVYIELDDLSLKIEIKPSLGDDYPAVMRQMERSGSNVLLVKDYCGTPDLELVKKFFKTKGIAVFLLSDFQ
jgi:hypothetical protein